jgi:hypothetical protein
MYVLLMREWELQVQAEEDLKLGLPGAAWS